jgi:hypothetical protein
MYRLPVGDRFAKIPIIGILHGKGMIYRANLT